MSEFHILKTNLKTLSGRGRPDGKLATMLSKAIIVLAMLSAPILGYTAGNCIQLFAAGQPPKIVKPIVRNNQTDNPKFLCRRMYAIEHSGFRHTAYWSAEKLDGSKLSMSAKRVNAFKADPDLSPFEAAKPSDYSNSGFDQGHLSPVGDMHSDPIAMLESFYMSNMVPQVPGNNRDGWNHFEAYVREMAQARDVLYVITGPVYLDKKIETIGASKVAVPSHIYKVIYDPKANAVLSIMVPNIPFRIQDLQGYVTNMATVQNATGITFFPGLKMFKNSKVLWTARTSD